MTLPIAYVDIRLSVHATEDTEKAKKAVLNLLPEDRVEEIMFKTEPLKGHYGNPITLFQTRIKDGELIRVFIENLSSRFSEQDREQISRELDSFLEKGNLYLRLDKQAAFEGVFRLRRGDPVHIRIHFRNKDKESVVNSCRELGLTS